MNQCLKMLVLFHRLFAMIFNILKNNLLKLSLVHKKSRSLRFKCQYRKQYQKRKFNKFLMIMLFLIPLQIVLNKRRKENITIRNQSAKFLNNLLIISTMNGARQVFNHLWMVCLYNPTSYLRLELLFLKELEISWWNFTDSTQLMLDCLEAVL